MDEPITTGTTTAEEVISTDVVAAGQKWANKYLIALGIIIILGIVLYV
ncbi:MAG: hypothetical protein JJE22_15755, partial [Bacteroidia bacterium]|nr:hypothetical protein [Bacteroidia bacterium]